MKCPHCRVEINPDFNEKYLGNDSEGYWSIFTMNCQNNECNKLIVKLVSGEQGYDQIHHTIVLANIKSEIIVRPLSSTRAPVPKEVDEIFAIDYKEACLILTFSPKASAALSRRCLQNILREKAGIKKGDLSTEIQQTIDSGKLPSHITESIDAVRNIGNFAAHPFKSTASGEIVDVEPGEADWTLVVLESLFDFYFVQPAIIKGKRDALNRKLTDAGKPPMK